MIDYDTMKEMLDMKYVEAFRNLALNPDKPFVKVGAQNPDVYFQGRETTNNIYENTPAIVQKYMDLLAKKIGRQYHLFDYCGAPDAEKIIIAMGSGCEVIEETVNYMVERGEKVGVLKIRLFRPFSVKDFIAAIPETVKKIAVLDRTKEPGSIGEPLYQDVVTALAGKNLQIIGGRYGLSSKEFTPSMVKAVFNHIDGAAFHGFTVGINDDVSNKSIPINEAIDTEPKGVKRCMFWGLGSDGTVGANKNSIKIIGDNTDMNAQGFFVYDSKKSGGITISHLRFGKNKIQSPYLISNTDFVALHNSSYIGRYNMLKGINEGGTFLLNSEFSNDEVFGHLTRDLQETIINKKIKFYNINALKIADAVGLGKRINTVMQAAFFIISGVLDETEAIDLIKRTIEKSYKAKGEHIVKMNWEAVDKTKDALKKIAYPDSVDKIEKSYEQHNLISDDAIPFAKNVIEKIMHLEGDDIPVSHMPIDGSVPVGTTKLEKRGIAPYVPKWIPENCIQCNQCSLICPHAAIRAKQIDPKDLENAPDSFKTLKSNTKNDKDLKFKIQVYIEDCTGCGNCINLCPAKTKALEFSPIDEERAAGERQNEVFFEELQDNILDGVAINSLKGSQFKTPLFEFSGACAGCGETPYVKLLSQLFGERMIVANATGCSSIYGGTFPTIPYTTSKRGKGPAWANSLFEDNAEYGYGMRLAVDANRDQLKWNIEQLLEKGVSGDVKDAFDKVFAMWTNTGEEMQEAAQKVKDLMTEALKSANAETEPIIRKIIELQDNLVDRSIWCLGGDGWAYDIGYGGLDHVLASNRNVNVMVVDTEVYSNTGGQASKATPLASIAKFAAAGKRTGKKDLGLISMSYGYIYVASICLAANPAQAIKAMMEAEAYNGPSLIIAYAPCIAHGIDMSKTYLEEKKAVQAGYWPLYRYNPQLSKEGKNPFLYETRDPSGDLMEFLLSETRYNALKRQFPEVADGLYKKAIELKQEKHEYYKKWSQI